MSKLRKRSSSKRRIFNYLVLNVMVFAAALNTGLNLLFFVGILMGLIFIIAFIAGTNNIRKITVKREIKSEIYEKEKVTFHYGLSSSFNSSFLEIKDSFPPHAGEVRAAYIPGIKANEKIKTSGSFSFNIPGVFFLDEITVSSSFPIAVASFSKTYRSEQQIVVFPEYFDLSHFPEERLEELSENEQFGTRIGAGENIWGMKPYEMGDRIRDIDWKVSSRTEELMVKVREEPRGKRIWVIPVMKDLKRNDDNAQVVRLSASIAKNRLDTDSVVGTVIGNRTSLPSGGRGQFYHLLKEFAHVWIERQERENLRDISGFLMPNDIVFLVTNSRVAQIEPYILNLMRNRVKVVTVNLSEDEKSKQTFLESAIRNEYLYYGGDPRRINEVFENVHN